MGYIIEISFDVRKHGAITKNKKEIYDKALNSNCMDVYDNFEFNGYRHNIYRSHCVITTTFANSTEDDFLQILNFLHSLQSLKYIHIESIFCEHPAHFVFVTKKYVNMMENKEVAAKLRKRQRTYSNEDLQILEVLSKRKG